MTRELTTTRPRPSRRAPVAMVVPVSIVASFAMVVPVSIVSCANPGPRPARLGEPCLDHAGLAPCEAALLCLDGRCVERPAGPRPEPPAPPPFVTFDVSDARDTSEVADADLDAPDLDAPDLDAPDMIDAPDAPDADADTTPTGEYRLGEHAALDTPSDTRLGLAPGQAAVREVAVPTPSEGLAVEVVVVNTTPTVACGRFRAIFWVPGRDGFAVPPTEVGPERELTATAGAPTVARLPFPTTPSGPIPLPEGPLRVGARYEGPCPDAAFSPWVALDASGLADGQYVWAQAWIPGATLDLPGRWALTAALRARLP